MTRADQHRGGRPVGFIDELGPIEAGAVLYLRLWCDGPDARDQVVNDFSEALGTQQGHRATRSFGMLCDLCVRHGRRPLLRHHVTCACLGSDESCFANFIGYASEGAREDAMLIASTFVRPDMAGSLVGLAEEFGLALRRMALTAKRPSEPMQKTTLH